MFWGGELLLGGAIVPRKRPRGRPRKDVVAVGLVTVANESVILSHPPRRHAGPVLVDADETIVTRNSPGHLTGILRWPSLAGPGVLASLETASLGQLATGGHSRWLVWRSPRASWLNTRSWTRTCRAPSTRPSPGSPGTLTPGCILEKPQHSRDGRIRTIRVDGSWRGVVLAPPDGDTYCLVTVLPPDKANAYAANHRFSVNRALGVLEVRDEEAVQQLQPSLNTAGPDGKRLFGDVSDADLTRLGVDAQILPTVRLLTGETDLEALHAVLPEAQYAALHALAGGMTVDEALGRGRPARCPAARRPSRWIRTTWSPPWSALPARSPSSPDRRSCSSSSPTRSRRGARSCTRASARSPTEPSYAGPAQVTGGPGTGKTVTVLHRAAFLAERAGRRAGHRPSAHHLTATWPAPCGPSSTC